jgi:hypothetical protein
MHKTGRRWYRKGNDAWYVWHAGKQVLLAKERANKAEAFARFAELLADPVLRLVLLVRFPSLSEV